MMKKPPKSYSKPKRLSSINTDIVVMTEITISNVAQILRRVVKNDGRIGALQTFKGKEVVVIVYENTTPENEGDENQ